MQPHTEYAPGRFIRRSTQVHERIITRFPLRQRVHPGRAGACSGSASIPKGIQSLEASRCWSRRSGSMGLRRPGAPQHAVCVLGWNGSPPTRGIRASPGCRDRRMTQSISERYTASGQYRSQCYRTVATSLAKPVQFQLIAGFLCNLAIATRDTQSRAFTESLRCARIHRRGQVRVTRVRSTALHTPQFDWVRCRLRHPCRPALPSHEPALAAKAIYYSSQHPRRKL